jgi:hypothetical protein
MFKCENCHTEYGGIRGLDAASCPRCRAAKGLPERRDWATRPFASASLAQPVSAAVMQRLLRRAG